MKFFKRLIQAYKYVKDQEKKDEATKVAESLLYDPMTLELIAKMAKECGRCFEIIRPTDGIALRFYENGFEPVHNDDGKGVW